MIIFYNGFNINLLTAILANIVLLILIFLICFFTKKKNNESYFREIPDNLPAGLISYYAKGKINKNIVWLTLMDLISRKYYLLTKNGNDFILSWNKGEILDFDTAGLYEYEIILIKFINFLIAETGSNGISLEDLKHKISININLRKMVNRFFSSYKATLKKSYGFIVKETNYIMASALIFIYSIFCFNPTDMLGMVICTAYTILVIMMGSVLSNLDFNIRGIISVFFMLYMVILALFPFWATIFLNKNSIIFAILIINPILLIIVTLILKMPFYTKKQKELYLKIKGLENFLDDFSRLDEKELQYINLFDRYYVMATIFGINLENNHYSQVEYDDDNLSTLTSVEFASKIVDLFFYSARKF